MFVAFLKRINDGDIHYQVKVRFWIFIHSESFAVPMMNRDYQGVTGGQRLSQDFHNRVSKLGY